MQLTSTGGGTLNWDANGNLTSDGQPTPTNYTCEQALKVDQLGLTGVGYAFPLTDTMDLYGKLGYAEVEIEAFDESVDDDGYELSVGLRASVMEQLELEGAVNYVDLSDSGDDTSFGVAARWYFMPQFALGIEREFGDDANSYGVSARWEFGRQ